MKNATTIAFLAALLAAGCHKDHSQDGPVSVPAPAQGSAAAPAVATMRVVVNELSADPSLDAQAIRDAFRDAETGFAGCLDGASGTGLLALSFAVEHDGEVADVVEGAATTYKSDGAKRCIERIIDKMTLPATAGSRASAAVVLEIRAKRSAE